MHIYFCKLVNGKDRDFANAREARNYVDRVILNQGRRLRAEMQRPDFDRERLFILESQDFML